MPSVKQGGIEYNIFTPLVWLDPGLNLGLLDRWQTLYPIGQQNTIPLNIFFNWITLFFFEFVLNYLTHSVFPFFFFVNKPLRVYDIIVTMFLPMSSFNIPKYLQMFSYSSDPMLSMLGSSIPSVVSLLPLCTYSTLPLQLGYDTRSILFKRNTAGSNTVCSFFLDPFPYQGCQSYYLPLVGEKRMDSCLSQDLNSDCRFHLQRRYKHLFSFIY